MPPGVLPIGSQGFPSLLNRLGIQPPLTSPFWYLSNVIQPVSLVDQEVDITVISAPVLFNEPPATTGAQNNPIADLTLADTGQLAAGSYDLKILATAYSGTTHNGFLVLERRNAANDATIWSVGILSIIGNSQGTENIERSISVPCDALERFRIRNVVALAATSTVSATIFFNRRS